MSDSSSASGPSKAGSVMRVAASGRRPSPNATEARPRSPPSGGLVRELEQPAVLGIARLGLVADEVGGERREPGRLHEGRGGLGVVAQPVEGGAPTGTTEATRMTRGP